MNNPQNKNQAIFNLPKKQPNKNSPLENHNSRGYKTFNKNEYINEGRRISVLEPEIREKKNLNIKYGGFAIVIAIVLVLIQFGLIYFLDLNSTEIWISAFILITIFGVTIYFLIEPQKEKEIRQKIIETEIRTVEKPIIKEVIKTIEVEKPIIQEIQTPRETQTIVREVPVYKDLKSVYADYSYTPIKTTKKKTYKTYGFIGSTETKTYHKSNCRFSKLIKPKYKLRGTTESFFKRKKYTPCKVCLDN